mmetsp:Transcript_14617/g.41750  ORF Transcript_14617/g.41750 Transcript_14617/m.41750 type:complete len:230 (-) Transcript_14617:12-701(-)
MLYKKPNSLQKKDISKKPSSSEHVLRELLLGAGERLAQRLVRQGAETVVLPSHGHPARYLLGIRLKYYSSVHYLVHRNQHQVDVLQDRLLLHVAPQEYRGGFRQGSQDLRHGYLVLLRARHDVEEHVGYKLVHDDVVVEHDDLGLAPCIRPARLGEQALLEVTLLLDRTRPLLCVILHGYSLPLRVQHDHGFHHRHAVALPVGNHREQYLTLAVLPCASLSRSLQAAKP